MFREHQISLYNSVLRERNADKFKDNEQIKAAIIKEGLCNFKLLKNYTYFYTQIVYEKVEAVPGSCIFKLHNIDLQVPAENVVVDFVKLRESQPTTYRRFP